MKLRKNLALIAAFFFVLNAVSYGADNDMNDLKKLRDAKSTIVQVGDPVLRTIAQPVKPEQISGLAFKQLIILMRNKMREAGGVGLAAPQIGVPLRIAVIEDKAEYLERLTPEEIEQRDRHPVPFQVIINPVITLPDPSKAVFYEGCLSVDGFLARVPRALKVEVDALNEFGQPIHIEAQGWYARILQHEIDHLDGTLYIDHMDTKTFTTVENYKKFQKDPSLPL